MNYLSPLTGKVKPRSFNVYDLETTTDLERVYLLGFYDGTRYRYFESEPIHPESPGSPVDQFMRWLTSSSDYCGQWNYAHNAGNFDALYLMRWVWENSEQFTIEVVPLQSSILMIELRSKANPRKRWTFLDSFRLMSSSLDKLGKAFGLGGKVPVPGTDPGCDCDKCRALTQEFYATLHTNPLRYEYLRKDCTLLYDCCNKFHQLIHAMGGDVGVTAPSTAMATFRRNFLRRDISKNRHPRSVQSMLGDFRMNNSLPTHRHFTTCVDTECPGCLHIFVREGYYGGRVEVFRESFDSGYGNSPHCDSAIDGNVRACACGKIHQLLTLLDVNSMYPAAMLEPMPVDLVGADLHGPKGEHPDPNLAGFVRCTVEVPEDCYLPPLPLRHEGKLIFPTGTFTGTWSSVELANLAAVGGRVVSVEKSVWFRCEKVLETYVRHFYTYRDKSRADYDEAFDMVAKLLLNSLYGKFGMNEKREKLWFFPSDDDFSEHTLTPIEDAMHGAFTEPVVSEQPYVVPQIAAWVTGIARSRLWRMMHDILKRGGRIWYCDTDSIVTDLDLPSSTALGELKEVCKVERAIFAAPKLYFLKQADGKEYVKVKGFGGGFGAGKLTEVDFLKVVRARGKLRTQRMTKLREGMKTTPGQRFPRMKTVDKGIHGADEKRVHLGNGDTRAIIIGKDNV